MFSKKQKQPSTLFGRVMDAVNSFADDLEYATRRKKRIDRAQIERGVRSVLGVGNAVVQVLSIFFPGARIVSQATKVMTLANSATDALGTTPQLGESSEQENKDKTPQQPQQPLN